MRISESRHQLPSRSEVPAWRTWSSNWGVVPDSWNAMDVPIYQHTFHLQFTTKRRPASEINQDDVVSDASGAEGPSAEQELLDFLKDEYSDILEPRTIQLGKATFGYERWVCVAIDGTSTWLLAVPEMPDSPKASIYHYGTSRLLDDCFMAFTVLQDTDRVEMDGELRMIVMPPSSWELEQGELPFQIQLRMTISAITPTVFESPSGKGVHRGTQVQELQRIAFSYIFPPLSTLPPYHGTTDIPFFLSVLSPAPVIGSKIVDRASQPETLVSTLLPFQRRTLVWMLSKEGMTINNSGQVVSKPPEGECPLFWQKIKFDESGKPCYFHRLKGTLSDEVPDEDEPLGGILAEEPGLGKTVECIGLILLNPAPPERHPTNMWWNAETQIDVKEIKTTLIITPASLAAQWKDEISRHAPHLKVMSYDGWAKLKVPMTEAEAAEARKNAVEKARQGKRKPKSRKGTKPKTSTSADSMSVDDAEDEILDWVHYVNTFDVVITTYNVLQQDLTVARAPPKRPRRDTATYSNIERHRSPLIMCEWYRVIMDEVQMVGGGKTEEMVSLIPRLSSWAVSGTPARAQVFDLIHVLKFLQVEAAAESSRIWQRLLLPDYVYEFTALFRRYAVRTTKAEVQSELTIPTQTRYLVSIELGRVERTVYDQTLQQALDALGLDSRGVAASEGWQVDTTVLRFWLRKLRGICTHPQVGQLQTTRDKLNKPGALKTMAEVLEGMRDQNWRTLMDNRKVKTQLMSLQAQLRQMEEGKGTRYRDALEILLAANKEATELVEDMKATIASHDAKGMLLKQEAALRRGAKEQGYSSDSEVLDITTAAGKGKEKAAGDASVALQDSEDNDLPHNAAGEEHALRRRALVQRLRDCVLTLHRIKFLLGDVYHILGASYSTSEDDAYAAAEDLRRDLLKTTEEAATRAMAQLVVDDADKGIKIETLLVPSPFVGKGGLRSAELMDEANQILAVRLNRQTELLWIWRARIYALLTQKLSGGDQATGDEYAQSLDSQGEAETYLEAYAALMADRRESLMAERTVLHQDSAKEKKKRKTRTAQEAAVDDESDEEDLELQPEHEVLKKQLTDARNELRRGFRGRAVKSVMIDLNAVAARIPKDDDPEKIMVKDVVKRLRKLINSQSNLIDRLESDLALFRKAFNERILYFRQLQEISDSVAEPTWEDTLSDAIEKAEDDEKELKTQISTGKARQRYLEHVAKNSVEPTSDKDEDDEVCILCRCDFTRGYITQWYGCMKAWLTRKEGKACPVCRVMIDLDQLQRFTIASDSTERSAAPPRIRNGELAPRSRREIEYNYIDPALFEEIEKVESNGSYGSKIQTLVRHLLHIQDTDPGAKSIVFSAWADSLHIVQHALENNGIPCLRIDQSKGKKNAAKMFKDQPELLVLLLHGERENAGLNVTCASRVFMLESVATIARIDRMGQTKPTEVFCYYADDTVEQNILDLAARQGVSLYTKEKCQGTLDPTSIALDTAKDIDAPAKKNPKAQKGDFIFRMDDMLAILFPHMFEDIEYLIPLEQEYRTSERASNAIAGPSRTSS
ncbi:hypothetical protein NEOLEDRAFT_1159005 [Neolentinus lepideus HHB14362 ss-1]|uniref:Helicase ATP-binding domain-containing protein n=1 Tax=Neolentinus lepideus HHB14362 ss-1 TaxID=1314782 RepID=A0A165NFL6_9AGAM|nr:hypothetical protein NEOLEDRAFT_1159005 [Neolentinus lepideus HHB14362 ss-1]